MVAMPDRQQMTVEEYFAFDEASELKWEYLDGMVFEVYAMAGASPTHNTIVSNAGTSLAIQTRDKKCRVLIADQRVKMHARAYAYPDVVVVCGKPEFGGHKNETLLNPTLIVEVLSPSTAKYDQGQKFLQYQALASLQEYVLIWQDTPLIQRYTRGVDGNWNVAVSIEGSFALESVGCTLELAEVYRNVEFPDSPPQPD